MLPALFVSHGAPTLALQDVPARHFLERLGATLPRPRAIVAVTAHWETAEPQVGAATHPRTIHDFGRFDDRLFRMQYNAPGDAALAVRVAERLDAAGLPGHLDHGRGLDHGVWVPLLLMYPDADIPVVPLSVQPDAGPRHHWQMGRALAGLGEADVLVIGSGSFTHDLGRFRGQALDTAAPDDVVAFADWFRAALADGRTEDVLDYRHQAPNAVENHPTEEHLLPLFTALGAAGVGGRAEHLHGSSTYGVLQMDAFAFHAA